MAWKRWNPGCPCCEAPEPACTDLPAGLTLFLTDANGTFEMVERDPGDEGGFTVYVHCSQVEFPDTVDGECVEAPAAGETGVGYRLYCDPESGLVFLQRFIDMVPCVVGEETVWHPIRTDEETGDGVCLAEGLPADADDWTANPDSLTVSPTWAATFELPSVSGSGIDEIMDGSVAISE